MILKLRPRPKAIRKLFLKTVSNRFLPNGKTILAMVHKYEEIEVVGDENGDGDGDNSAAALLLVLVLDRKQHFYF